MCEDEIYSFKKMKFTFPVELIKNLKSFAKEIILLTREKKDEQNDKK